jgi:hypothetical protein
MTKNKSQQTTKIDLWQVGKEFSKLGSERLANLLISASERSDSLRRVLYIWSAFIIFDKDQDFDNLENNLIPALTIDDFKDHNESDSYDLVIYELQDFLNKKMNTKDIDQKSGFKDLFEQLKPTLEESSTQLSEDFVWSKALEEMTETFNQV